MDELMISLILCTPLSATIKAVEEEAFIIALQTVLESGLETSSPTSQKVIPGTCLHSQVFITQVSERPIDFRLTVKRNSALKLHNMGKVTQSLIVTLIVMAGIVFAASAIETRATAATSGGNVDSSRHWVSTKMENVSDCFQNISNRVGSFSFAKKQVLVRFQKYHYHPYILL